MLSSLYSSMQDLVLRVVQRQMVQKLQRAVMKTRMQKGLLLH